MKTLNKISLLYLIILTGCTSVPSSQFSIKFPTGETWSYNGERDTTLKGIAITIKNGTNEFSFKADSIISTNSPAAMTAAGASVVGQINAINSLIGTVAEKAAK